MECTQEHLLPLHIEIASLGLSYVKPWCLPLKSIYQPVMVLYFLVVFPVLSFWFSSLFCYVSFLWCFLVSYFFFFCFWISSYFSCICYFAVSVFSCFLFLFCLLLVFPFLVSDVISCIPLKLPPLVSVLLYTSSRCLFPSNCDCLPHPHWSHLYLVNLAAVRS